jgi:DNA-binding NarL/FixJ family response regulator
MSKYKVMLVEDDEMMLSLIGALLELEGYEVVGLDQSAGQEGIMSALRREKPALVLLDVNLRQINGIDLLRCIRKSVDLKLMKVLMTSGMDYGLRCYQEGADGFLLKPYMPEELIEKIRQSIEG